MRNDFFHHLWRDCQSAWIITLMLIPPLLFATTLTRAAVLRPSSSASQATTATTSLQPALQREIRLLAGYSVFDWIEAEIDAQGVVTLRGQVVRQKLKAKAEHQLLSLPGVQSVRNQIEVLPTSYDDERMRSRAYLALFGAFTPLFRYATHEVPPFHLLVKNGRITLKGVVHNAMDSQLAAMKLRGVRGVREVINQLHVATAAAPTEHS